MRFLTSETEVIPPHVRAMTMAQPGALLRTVPTEILDLILGEAKHSGEYFLTFCDLRLVCKSFNSLIEPLAFASVTLLRYNLQLPVFCSQLECLASGKSANSRWTKRLRIFEQTLPSLVKEGGDLFSWQRTNPELEERKRQEALVVQRRYLARAIGALKHVTHVIYHPRENEAYEEVLLALSRLPHLEDLSISFCSTFDNKPLPLASFSNLRTVKLTHPRFRPSVIGAVRDMLKRSSTTLESLTLAPFDWSPMHIYMQPSDTETMTVVGLEKFLSEDFTAALPKKPTPKSFFSKLNPVLKRQAPAPSPTLPSHTQYGRLREIVINSNRISLSAAVVPSIPSLAHLEAKDRSSGNVDDSFWKALMKTDIHLEFLKIWPVTKPLVRYLSSYSGLRTLHLRDPEDGEPTFEGEADHLLTSVLPRHHGQSLEGLWLEGPSRKGYHLTQERMKGVLRCTGIQTLWISYYYFPDASRFKRRPQSDSSEPPPSLDLSHLLSSLTTSLPNLRLLYIEPTHRIPSFGCGTGRMGYIRGVKKKFLTVLEEISIAEQTPAFSISVKGPFGGLILNFDEETRRFIVVRDLWEEERHPWLR